MFEIPTGSAAVGAENLGSWTTYGGGGVTLVNGPGYRNFPFAGWPIPVVQP
jgi:hypothetical protein